MGQLTFQIQINQITGDRFFDQRSSFGSLKI